MSFVVGLVAELEPVPNKDKLSKLLVDVGGDTQLTIVTNAPNVQSGTRVVVAKIGCTLKDGTEVKKAMVGGVPSEGMLCDPPMLGWVGGGAGNAAVVPDSFSPGDEPPASRPRMDQPKEAAAPAVPAADVKPLFEKKLSKEEKKAEAAKKKAERDAGGFSHKHRSRSPRVGLVFGGR